jgi:deubiquitinating protein VCIP135
MSTVTGRDLWTYIQTMPHLFSVGGLFYKQMERDLGLVEGKHCQLPVLPGKVGHTLYLKGCLLYLKKNVCLVEGKRSII